MFAIFSDFHLHHYAPFRIIVSAVDLLLLLISQFYKYSAVVELQQAAKLIFPQQNTGFQHDNYTNDFTLAHRKKTVQSIGVCVCVCALKCTCLLCYNAFSFIPCLFSLVQHIDVSLVYCLLAHINAIQKPQIDGKYEF